MNQQPCREFDSLHLLDRRICRLERSNVRWRIIAVALLAFSILTGAQQAEPDILTARQLNLTDAQGKLGAMFAVSDDGEAIVMLGSSRGAAFLDATSVSFKSRDETFTAHLGRAAQPLPAWLDAPTREKLGLPKDMTEWPPRTAGLSLRAANCSFRVSLDGGKPVLDLRGEASSAGLDTTSLTLVSTEDGDLKTFSANCGHGARDLEPWITDEMKEAVGLARDAKQWPATAPRVELLSPFGNFSAEVSQSGPALALGSKGVSRAILGVATTEDKDGREVTYPPSSLLLFGPDGVLRWSAP